MVVRLWSGCLTESPLSLGTQGLSEGAPPVSLEKVPQNPICEHLLPSGVAEQDLWSHVSCRPTSSTNTCWASVMDSEWDGVETINRLFIQCFSSGTEGGHTPHALHMFPCEQVTPVPASKAGAPPRGG